MALRAYQEATQFLPFPDFFFVFSGLCYLLGISSGSFPLHRVIEADHALLEHEVFN
jgi:hypothetical protein